MSSSTTTAEERVYRHSAPARAIWRSRRMSLILASKRLGSRGTAALEFGLAMPFLLALTVGVTEVGMLSYQAMQVKDAAEAGVVYASQNPADFTGIQNAVTSATGTAGITASPAPTGFCGCPGASGIAIGDC